MAVWLEGPFDFFQLDSKSNVSKGHKKLLKNDRSVNFAKIYTSPKDNNTTLQSIHNDNENLEAPNTTQHATDNNSDSKLNIEKYDF